MAQAPDRHEPDSEGEINYRYVLKKLEQAGYTGFVGAEYTPAMGVTAAGLGWMEAFGLHKQ